eukprot:746756-Hanusia_phi.AAC.10
MKDQFGKNSKKFEPDQGPEHCICYIGPIPQARSQDVPARRISHLSGGPASFAFGSARARTA